MLDVAPTELLLVAIVALLVIGPKDLPKAMRFVGKWVGKARGVARQFRSGFDTMVREAELEEMEKKWAEENARIMREHPVDLPVSSASAATALPAEEEAGASNSVQVADDIAARNVADHDRLRDDTSGTGSDGYGGDPVLVEKPVVEPSDIPFGPGERDVSPEPVQTADKAPS